MLQRVAGCRCLIWLPAERRDQAGGVLGASACCVGPCIACRHASEADSVTGCADGSCLSCVHGCVVALQEQGPVIRFLPSNASFCRGELHCRYWSCREDLTGQAAPVRSISLGSAPCSSIDSSVSPEALRPSSSCLYFCMHSRRRQGDRHILQYRSQRTSTREGSRLVAPFKAYSKLGRARLRNGRE